MSSKKPNVKAWLYKGTDLYLEQRSVLTWGYVFNYNGAPVAATTNGYRMHLSWVIPEDLIGFTATDGVQCIEFPTSEEKESAVKWSGKAPMRFSNVFDMVFGNELPQATFRPNHFFNAIKVVEKELAHFGLHYLQITATTNAITLESDGRYAVFPAVVSEPFEFVVNPNFLFDALLMHRGKKAMVMRYGGAHQPIALGEHETQMAIIMPLFRRPEAA